MNEELEQRLAEASKKYWKVQARKQYQQLLEDFSGVEFIEQPILQ